MVLLEAARTYPVLGRFDDYSEFTFDKSFVINSETWKVEIKNPPNRVNEIAKGEILEVLVIENPYASKKIIVPLKSETETVRLKLDDFLGDVSLTLMQIAEDDVKLISSNSFSKFFSNDLNDEAEYDVRPGEILGFGDTQILRVDPSGGASWIQFSNTQKPGFDFEVALGDKVVINVGSDLHKLVTLGSSDPITKHWINLSFVRSALEVAIAHASMNRDANFDDQAQWEDHLRELVQDLPIQDSKNNVGISEVQKVALSLMVDESLKPVLNSITRIMEND
jgi:hypothetical protein